MIKINHILNFCPTESDGKCHVSCDFMIDPRSLLNATDISNLKTDPTTAKISQKAINEILTLCESSMAKRTRIWCFIFDWRAELPVTNQNFADPLFETIKAKYPEKFIVIRSSVTTHRDANPVGTEKKEASRSGIPNYTIVHYDRTPMTEFPKLSFVYDNYIVIGDQKYQDAFELEYKKANAMGQIHKYVGA